MGKRKSGILYYESRCKGGRKVKTPLFFSFRLKEEEEELLAFSFSPPDIIKLLKGREFLLMEDEFGSRLKKARAVKIKEDSCTVKLLSETIEEKRIYDRFSFCPEKLGEFNVKKDNEDVAKVTLLDLSLLGVKFSLKGHVKVKPGDYLVMNQGTRIFNLRVLRVSREKGELIVGAKILKSNFNLIGFIIDKYVKVVKELISN